MNREQRRRAYFENRRQYDLRPTWQEHNAQSIKKHPILNMTKRIATRKSPKYDNAFDFNII